MENHRRPSVGFAGGPTHPEMRDMRSMPKRPGKHSLRPCTTRCGANSLRTCFTHRAICWSPVNRLTRMGAFPTGWQPGKPHRNAAAYDFVCSAGWMTFSSPKTHRLPPLEVLGQRRSAFWRTNQEFRKLFRTHRRRRVPNVSARCEEGNMRLAEVVAEGSTQPKSTKLSSLPCSSRARNFALRAFVSREDTSFPINFMSNLPIPILAEKRARSIGELPEDIPTLTAYLPENTQTPLLHLSFVRAEPTEAYPSMGGGYTPDGSTNMG